MPRAFISVSGPDLHYWLKMPNYRKILQSSLLLIFAKSKSANFADFKNLLIFRTFRKCSFRGFAICGPNLLAGAAETEEGEGNRYRRQGNRGGVKETRTRGIKLAAQQSRSRLCNKEVQVISHLTIRGQKGEGLFQVLNSTLVMPGIAFSLLKNIKNISIV
jgi:hypothetical protein